MVCGISPTTTRPGLQTNRESDRPRSRLPSSLSPCHSATPLRQLAKPGRWEGLRRHSIHRCIRSARETLPSCLCIVQQLSIYSHPQPPAPCASVEAESIRRPGLRQTLQRQTFLDTKDGTRRAQNEPHLHIHVEIHPSRQNVRRRSVGTGVREIELSRVSDTSAYCTMPVQMHTCRRQYSKRSNFSPTIHPSSRPMITHSGPTTTFRNNASTIFHIVPQVVNHLQETGAMSIQCLSTPSPPPTPLLFQPAVETRLLKRTVVHHFIMCSSQSCSVSASARPLVQSAMSSANSRSGRKHGRSLGRRTAIPAGISTSQLDSCFSQDHG
jgi:hypothetical protein